MNKISIILLGGLLLYVWVGILWAFKSLYLDKIKSGVLKYSLGMMFVYVILFLLYVAAEQYLPLKTFIANWYFQRAPGGIVLILVPAFYSIFLIGKGYFQEGGEKAPFKWKLKMIASVFLNAFIALFSLVFFSFLLRGNSFADLVTTTQEAVQEISWGLMLAFVAFWGLILIIIWFNHKKSLQKSKHKKKK
ncbi:hypothetical protein [Prevotella aurantiaca]|uniref:hypothetical protein n=1 Tax=Prevotella aurantiaca TaxID=596085 RepID=UPI0028DC17EB|nr:hypothetical protein [Prevotella aurantiaca]